MALDRTLDSKIQNLIGQVSLVDVMREYSDVFHKGGERYMVRCPFHGGGAEQNPSMSLDNDKGVYYCFACGASGNVFTLLKEKAGLPFKDAVHHLGKRFGVDTNAFFSKKSEKELSYANSLYKANEYAMRLFGKMLLSKKADGTYVYPTAMAYLEKRGIPPAIVKTFKLGFAPPKWNALYAGMKGAGFGEKTLSEAGLIKEKNGHYFDRFINRVMFPIFNEREEVIAFGGRVLDNMEPKYLNSPETKLFQKKRTLYGIHAAKKAILDAGEAFILEGYMDVIACHKMGVRHAVGTLGTALTPDHIRLLRRYTKSVVFGFDNDAAGMKAAARGIACALEGGVSVSVFTLSGAKDIDEFFESNDIDAFRLLYEKKQSWYDFLIEYERDRAGGDTPEQKADLAKSLFSYIRLVGSRIEQDGLLQHLADTLSMPAGMLRDEYAKFERESRVKNAYSYSDKQETHADAGQESGREYKAEKEIIYLLTLHPDLIPKAAKGLSIDMFKGPVARELYLRLLTLEEEKNVEPYDAMIALENEAIARRIQERADDKRYADDAAFKLHECITHLRKRVNEERSDEIEKAFQDGTLDYKKNSDIMLQLLKQKIDLNKERIGLSQSAVHATE